MRVVIQRVSEATVKVQDQTTGKIEKGLLVFVGIEDPDNEEDVIWISKKIVQMRIFNDENEVMNQSLKDVGGGIMLVSQFTLHASTRKGNRPSYSRASKGEIAVPIYEKLISQLGEDLGKKVETGIFGADMQVELVNDGPVTIFIDTRNKE
jgi:D-tyrosyl-tRNA(Tyr) deacylase